MATTAVPLPDADRPLRGAGRAPLVVVGGSFLAGVLTSVGQGHLPAALHDVANSSLSWSVVAFALALLGRRWWVCVLFATGAFVGQLAGYDVASQVRVGHGLALSTWAFWLVQGALAGPVLGLVAWWGRRDPGLGRALAVAALGGLALGEGVYGLTVVAATTSPVWWSISVGLGVAAVAAYAVSSRSGRWSLVAGLGAVLVGAGFWWAYQLAGTVLAG